MKKNEFVDNLIGVCLLVTGLAVGSASVRYLITGSIATTTVQPVVIQPLVNNEQDCYQIFGGACSQK